MDRRGSWKRWAAAGCFSVAAVVVLFYLVAGLPLSLSGGEYATPPETAWDKAGDVALVAIIFLVLAGLPALAGFYLLRWPTKENSDH